MLLIDEPSSILWKAADDHNQLFIPHKLPIQMIQNENEVKLKVAGTNRVEEHAGLHWCRLHGEYGEYEYAFDMQRSSRTEIPQSCRMEFACCVCGLVVSYMSPWVSEWMRGSLIHLTIHQTTLRVTGTRTWCRRPNKQ